MEMNDWLRNQIRNSVVEMMVEKARLEQKLAGKKMTVSDEDITKEIESIAKQQNLKMEDVPAEIAKYGMTMDDLKGQIRMSVQRDKLIEAEMTDKEIKDEDVKKFYDDNPQYFERPEQAHAAHILIMTQGKSDEEKAAAKTKIEDILKKAKAGADFSALAKEFSEDPGSKDQGGEYTFPRGQMVPAFEEAAFTRKNGEISGVVETEYG
jgi:parvulin-like peptidyl-prolyl isomerase